MDIDWRREGAIAPIQQQHPFGTCWAFSMTAVTEAVMVIQGKKPLVKLSEQMTVSCVPETACGDNADVLWSWAFHNTGGRYQTDKDYPYNRTCNFFREQQLAPDGTNDGYPGTCNLPGPPPFVQPTRHTSRTTPFFYQSLVSCFQSIDTLHLAACLDILLFIYMICLYLRRYAPCPPCPGVERKDGTPECLLDSSSTFSDASIQGFLLMHNIIPHCS